MLSVIRLYWWIGVLGAAVCLTVVTGTGLACVIQPEFRSWTSLGIMGGYYVHAAVFGTSIYVAHRVARSWVQEQFPRNERAGQPVRKPGNAEKCSGSPIAPRWPSTDLQECDRGNDQEGIPNRQPRMGINPINEGHSAQSLAVHHQEVPVADFHCQPRQIMTEKAQGKEHGHADINRRVLVDRSKNHFALHSPLPSANA